MFFKEKNFIDDIIIPRVFFEQIIPLSQPEILKVYLYGYFLALDESEEFKDNEALADKLNMSLDTVLSAWAFYESCGIVKRHFIDGTNKFSVEFLDFSRPATKKKTKKELSTHEMVLISQNEEHKKMLDNIESIIGTFLTPDDIRKVENFLQEYNMHKAVIIEAFSFAVEKKRNRTVKAALSIARTWYLEGVRSVEELENYKVERSNRYKEYKKVLTFLGEYRTPTKPEEALIDKWLDEYKFSIEVIEEACKKSTSIKSPNLAYIDGVLKNWDKEAEKLNIKPANQFQDKDPTIYRVTILERLGHKGKILTKEERGYMKSIYDAFALDDVLLAVANLRKTSEELNLSDLYNFLFSITSQNGIDNKRNDRDNGKINLDDINSIVKAKSPRVKDKENKKIDISEKRKSLLAKAKKWEEEV